ncbi:MAG: helix-turn-helix domain-containing protein, partial [Patescibacteria group bacterium]|nr:helix-turn-helix domain-containing protein [Patescibacteria group bacterium]
MQFFRHKKIKNDKQFGEILSKERKRQNFSLEVAEEKTKVSLKYLQAMEASDFSNLPADVYALGFLRRYSDFLGLNYQKISENFLEDKQIYSTLSYKNNHDKPSIIKPAFNRTLSKGPSLVVTPKILLSGLVIFLVVGILGYIFYQVKSFAAAPPLSIAGNFANMKVKVNSITVDGQTDASASLMINNQPVAVDASGKFSQEIKLISGVNEIEVTA